MPATPCITLLSLQIDAILAEMTENMANLEQKLGEERTRQAKVCTFCGEAVTLYNHVGMAFLHSRTN